MALCAALVMGASASIAATNDSQFAQVGFSTLAAYGQAGTTGGGDVTPTIVRTAKEFLSAAERLEIKHKKVRDTTPTVILIAHDIDLGELKNVTGNSTEKSVGIIRIRPHTTIYSTNAATLRRGTLEVHGTWNIIIRDLKFRDLWEFDPTGKYDKLGWDFVRITDQGEQIAHHIWVDHCDFEKAYDGLLDVVHGSDLVTISWCRFAGDTNGPQKKVTLIGHSSGPSAAEIDRGRLNVTLHHNLYENIEDRVPRARFGNIHAFNNVVIVAQYATMSVMGAVTLVENSIYRDAKCATSFSHAKDSALKEKGGTICIVNSLNENPRTAKPAEKADERFEQENNFKSNVERGKLEFNKPAGFAWENRNQLPYRYEADATDKAEKRVKSLSGATR